MTRDRMHVLMTADTVGGVWTYALELARALGGEDVDVTIAAMGAPLSKSQARDAAELPNLDVRDGAYALEWMPDPWRDVDAAGDWLLGLAGDTRADVVHVNGYAHAALPFGVPTVAVAHSCVLTWYRAVRGVDAPAEWDEYRRRVRHGLSAADELVAPTRAILDAVLGAHGIACRGRVIGNARTACPAKAAKEPFVFAAGRLWDEAKGLPELAAAADKIGWPVRVAGATRAPDGHEVAASAVVSLGELSPRLVQAWMARAAIYALPARYEPFGLSILEAALAGCALVVGDVPSLREVWGDCAVYARPGDPGALASALRVLIGAPERRRQLGAAARARAKTFSPLRMARAYRDLYDELRARKRREACA